VRAVGHPGGAVGDLMPRVLKLVCSPRGASRRSIVRVCAATLLAAHRASRLRDVGSRRIPAVLSIAGSDSGGGAGIQADLKAFARCGVHGMTAITAITAQNTVGVSAVEPVSPATILAQVRAVAEDIGVDAVKIGMLGTAETVEAVVEALSLLGDAPVVVDPVIVAESGAVLLSEDAREALIERLLPLGAVLTPNVPEARELTGAGGSASQEELAEAMFALGPRAVVVTGGHSERMVDLFFDGGVPVAIEGERHPDGATHGSGCTHSAALAAFLAHGETPLEAARHAREVVAAAVGAGLRDIGRGPGPVDVFDLTSRFQP
jgi:hydroxymethylpyrimidine/phosphomethylpyrimidine kinase